jgi:hypothetical protein
MGSINKDYTKEKGMKEIGSKVSKDIEKDITISKGIRRDAKVNVPNRQTKTISSMDVNTKNINKNTKKTKDVKVMPTNKAKVILTPDQIDQRVIKLGDRKYMNLSQHELIVAGKFFEGVDFVIQKELAKSLQVKEIIKKGNKSFTTLYGITYSILNLEMYQNTNTIEKFGLLKRVSNLTTKYLTLLNTMGTLTKFKFNPILNAQIKLVVTSMIDKEYDITCLLDSKYYAGLTEKQCKEKYPSKDQTLSILQYKLKNVSSSINTIIREMVKEAFNTYTNIFNIVFKNLPGLLRNYIYEANITLREKAWLDIDYILTVLDLGYFNKDTKKLNALFTPMQRNQLETYIEELMLTIKIPYICSLILVQTPGLGNMFRDYGFSPKYVTKFDLFKTNHSNMISLSPKFFSENQVISNTQFTNLLSAIETITTNLLVLLVTTYGEEYNEIARIINFYKANPLEIEELIPNVISEKVEIVKEEIPIQSTKEETLSDKDVSIAPVQEVITKDENSPKVEASVEEKVNPISENIDMAKLSAKEESLKVDEVTNIPTVIAEAIKVKSIEEEEKSIAMEKARVKEKVENTRVENTQVKEKVEASAEQTSTNVKSTLVKEKQDSVEKAIVEDMIECKALDVISPIETVTKVDNSKRDAWMKPVTPYVKADRVDADLKKKEERRLHKEQVKLQKLAKRGISKDKDDIQRF